MYEMRRMDDRGGLLGMVVERRGGKGRESEGEGGERRDGCGGKRRGSWEFEIGGCGWW